MTDENRDAAGWTTLGELPPGSVFETRDGTRAVMTRNPFDDAGYCFVVLGTGGAVYFGERNHSTPVRVIPVGLGGPTPKIMPEMVTRPIRRYGVRVDGVDAATFDQFTSYLAERGFVVASQYHCTADRRPFSGAWLVALSRDTEAATRWEIETAFAILVDCRSRVAVVSLDPAREGEP